MIRRNQSAGGADSACRRRSEFGQCEEATGSVGNQQVRWSGEGSDAGVTAPGSSSQRCSIFIFIQTVNLWMWKICKELRTRFLEIFLDVILTLAAEAPVDARCIHLKTKHFVISYTRSYGCNPESFKRYAERQTSSLPYNPGALSGRTLAL